jgi:hypothetical protein
MRYGHIAEYVPAKKSVAIRFKGLVDVVYVECTPAQAMAWKRKSVVVWKVVPDDNGAAIAYQWRFDELEEEQVDEPQRWLRKVLRKVSFGLV